MPNHQNFPVAVASRAASVTHVARKTCLAERSWAGQRERAGGFGRRGLLNLPTYGKHIAYSSSRTFVVH